MNEQEMNEWNEKVRALKEHIHTEFPKGCSGLNSDACDKCILSDEFPGTRWHYLCSLMGELSGSYE